MQSENIIMKGGVRASVESDGTTVWVNAVMCIGRFGRAGIDIHQPMEKQSSAGECLYCTHEYTDKKDWETFKEKMSEFYGATISDEHMPRRLKEAKPWSKRQQPKE